MKVTGIKKYLGLLCLVCLITTTAIAQSSDKGYAAETLDNFIKATKEVTQIQQEGEKKMVKAIEEENLDVETFNEIAELMMSPEKTTNSDITPEQIVSFNNVIQKLQAFQIEMEEEMENAIENRGMDVEEYQKIVEDYHNDPGLQKQIQERLQE